MKLINKLSFLAMAITTLVVMPSCEDDVNSSEMYAALRLVRNEATNMNISGNYDAAGVITLANPKDKVKFAVVLSREAEVDVTATIGVNNSLLDVYNKEKKTDYIAFSNEDIIIENVNPVVRPGQISSVDTIEIRFNTEKMVSGSTYLLPVQLTELSSKDKGVAISSNNKTIYVVVKYNINNIDRTAGAMTGTDISRTNWGVKVSDYFADTDKTEGFLIDNNPATFWRSIASKISYVYIDMKSPKSVRCFEILTASGPTGPYGPKTITVSSSSDNVTWEVYGVSQTISKPANATAPGVKSQIKFLYAKPMQYYKLEITSSYTPINGASIAEITALE